MSEIPDEVVPGEYCLNVSWDGGEVTRKVLLIVPESYDPAGSHPLVHVLHGSHGSADRFRAGRPNLVSAANARGYILAFPEGRPNQTGNGFLWDSGVEDNRYITKLTAGLIDGLAVDPTRIVLTGFSGGAGLAQRVGGARADLFAGLVSFGGTTGLTVEDPETGEDIHYQHDLPREPIPAILVRGGLDELIPPQGENRNGERFDSMSQQLEFWLAGNGCDPEDVETSMPDEGVTVRRAGTDNRGTLVVLVYGENLDHRWPGGHHRSNIDGDQLVIGFVSSLPSLKAVEIAEIEFLQDGWFHLQFSGESGHLYTFETSPNLKGWEVVPVWETQDEEQSVVEIVGTGELQSVFVKAAESSPYLRVRSHGAPLDFGDTLFE